MIVIPADIVNAVLGLLGAVRKKSGPILDRALTDVVRLTTTDFNEKIFAALRRLADRLNPPEFVRASPLL
jgi:hypothetical protein